MTVRRLVIVLTFVIIGLGSSMALSADVKITPLGAAPGEFCVGDRALLFEDPTGVRVLIAPGRTVGLDTGAFVRGSADPRLQNSLHVLLIDHPHVDHLGDVFHTTCAGAPTKPFEFPSESNAAEIAARLNAAVLVGGEMPDFFTQKIKNVNAGTAPAGCLAAGLDNTFTVPLSAPCVGVIRGGTRTAVFKGGTNGVKITTIPAFHAAGASRMHIDTPNVPVGLTGYAGHETGYILRFTNGLTVLWTGDSGLIGDWETQSRFYKPNLAVVHGGDLFTMGPDEAAFAVNELINPRTVIPEHFNQVSTTKGKVNAGTKLERFIQQVNAGGNHDDRHGDDRRDHDGVKVIVPLSGVPISCDGKGNCH